MLRLVLLQFRHILEILLIGVIVWVIRRLRIVKVAATLLLVLAVLSFIGLVVRIVLVTALGVAHAETASLWVLFSNIQAVKVLTLGVIVMLSLVHLPMLGISRLEWVSIKYELPIHLLAFELRMVAVERPTKILALGLVTISLKLLSSILVWEVSTSSIVGVKTRLLLEVLAFLCLAIVRLIWLIVTIDELRLVVTRNLIVILVVPNLVSGSIKWLCVISTVVSSIFIVGLLLNTMFFMIRLLFGRMSVEV